MGRGGRGHQSSKFPSTLLLMEGRKWGDIYFLGGSKVDSVMGNLLDLLDMPDSLTTQGHCPWLDLAQGRGWAWRWPV